MRAEDSRDMGHTKALDSAVRLENVHLYHPRDEITQKRPAFPRPLVRACQILLLVLISGHFIMLYRSFAVAAAVASLVDGSVVRRQSASSSSSTNIPDYYVTKPELLPGECRPRY